MSTFRSTKTIGTTLTDFGGVAKTVATKLEAEGYTVSVQETAEGYFLSLSKGGVFKTISGMKTSLNVTMKKSPAGMLVEAGVGIFGQQALPTAISMLIFWPVLITQVVGMIQQSQLDDKVITMIEEAVKEEEASGTSATGFCHACGKQLPFDSAFCPSCGAKQ